MLSLLASLSATTRPPALSGVFLSAYEQNVAFSQQRRAAELDAMASVGIHTIIIGESASSTWPNYSTPLGERVRVYAFWPTQIGASVPGYEMVDTGHPFVERVLTAADARKMSVVLGNADVPWVDQGGNQSWAMQAALSLASDANQIVGSTFIELPTYAFPPLPESTAADIDASIDCLCGASLKLGSFLGQPQRRGAPDAGRTARHHGTLSRKAHPLVLSFCVFGSIVWCVAPSIITCSNFR